MPLSARKGAGLNPHAGEEGILGREEKEWIKNIYWKLEKYSNVLVLRNKKWFNNIDTICRGRNDIQSKINAICLLEETIIQLENGVGNYEIAKKYCARVFRKYFNGMFRYLNLVLRNLKSKND